jgi:hypothetical protein
MMQRPWAKWLLIVVAVGAAVAAVALVGLRVTWAPFAQHAFGSSSAEFKAVKEGTRRVLEALAAHEGTAPQGLWAAEAEPADAAGLEGYFGRLSAGTYEVESVTGYGPRYLKAVYSVRNAQGHAATTAVLWAREGRKLKPLCVWP